jgi:Na+/phosphate symporter
MSSTTPPQQTGGIHLSRDIVAGLFLIVIAGIGYAGTLELPSVWAGVGPGLLPKLVAGLIALVGVLIMLLGMTSSAERLQSWTLRGPVFVLGAAIVFAATIRTLGLAVAGPLTWIIAAMADPDSRWAEIMLFALLMTVLCVGLFKYALRLPIPLLPFVLGY